MAVNRLFEHLSKAMYSVGSSRSEGGWGGRCLVAACVAAILPVLVSFACASPPDPLWIPGIYDYHDYDDVVGMVTDAPGVSDSQVTQRVECIFVGFVLRAATWQIPGPIAHLRTIRGPPIETRDASADALLTPAPNLLPQLSIALIVSAPSRGVARSFCSWMSRVISGTGRLALAGLGRRVGPRDCQGGEHFRGPNPTRPRPDAVHFAHAASVSTFTEGGLL
jgi:hypothetical protein